MKSIKILSILCMVFSFYTASQAHYNHSLSSSSSSSGGFNTTPTSFTINSMINPFARIRASISGSPAFAPPSAPIALAATDVYTGSFEINWSLVSGATSYFLDLSTESDFSTFVPGYNNVSTSTFTGIDGNIVVYNNISSGVTYYYRLRAVNSDGQSANSNVITVYTSSNAPTATVATNITNSSFTANWNSLPGAIDYLVEVSASSNFSSIYTTRTSAGTSAEVSSLGPGTFYYYRVRARKASGISPYASNVITVGTLVPAPAVYAATVISANSFTANWQAATGSTGYAIDVSTASDFSSFVTGYNNLSLPGGQFSTVINNVSPITTYYYRLRATSNTGPSVNSNTIAVLTVPLAPVATTASNISGTSFTANWNNVPGASAYHLDVSTSSDFSTMLTGYDNLSVAGTSRSITGLSAGTTYYYRVRAINASGSSENSNTVSLSTLITPPEAPVAQPATNVYTGSFEINWLLAEGATGYLLDLSTESDFSSFVDGYNNVSTSNFTGIDGNIVV